MRKLMWLAVGFTAVCALCAYCSFAVPAIIVIGIVIGAIVLGKFAGESKLLRTAQWLLIGISAGVIWFSFFDAVYLSPAKGVSGKVSYVSFTANHYSESKDYGCSVDGFVHLEGMNYKVRAYLNEDAELKPGDHVVGSFYLRFTSDGPDSEASYQRGEGIFLILSQRGNIEISKTESLPWYGYPAYWNRVLTERIDEIFPADTASFAKALLLGDRDGLDYKAQRELKTSGIMHIIAVSGLHVSILFGLIYSMTLHKRILTFLLGIPSLVLFAAIIGFTPSVTRACIMQILMILSLLAKREYDPPTALSFSMLVMLIFNPYTITSVSLQLSAGSMIGILLFSNRIRQWILNPKRLGEAKGKSLSAKLKRWFAGSVSVTLSAMVTTTPFLAKYFSMVSLVGPLTNLLTLWIVTYVFYGILLCCLVSLLSLGAGSACAWLLSWLIRYVTGIASVMSDAPLSSVSTESIYIVIWLIGCYLLIAVFLASKKKSPVLLACCTAMALAVSLLASWTEPLIYNCHMTVMDVGQGQCILLQCDGKSFLVDCGGDYPEGAADTAVQLLQSRGISRLDAVIITHFDQDHAAGVPLLLTQIDANFIVMPDAQDDSGLKESLCSLEDSRTILLKDTISFSMPDQQIHVLGPASYQSGNESSLCILFQSEKCDILITGDRGEVGEMILLQQFAIPQLDVLVVGHHGSATSTSQRLLDATDPEIAIISVGEDNRYGHPAESVLDRLTQAGCQIFRTDQNGTIVFKR